MLAARTATSLPKEVATIFFKRRDFTLLVTPVDLVLVVQTTSSSSDCRCTKRRFPRSRYGLVSGLKSASIFEVIGKVSALLPDEVEIVTTDEFVSLARAAAPIRK